MRWLIGILWAVVGWLLAAWILDKGGGDSDRWT